MSDPPAVPAGRVRAGGREIAFLVRRMRRRRHVHLMIDDEGRVEVRTPPRYPEAEAAALVRKHAHWVLEALERLEARQRARAPLADGTALPLLDERLRLTVIGQGQLDLWPVGGPVRGVRTLRVREGRVWCCEGRINVEPTVPGHAATRLLLERWYRREARERLTARLEVLAAEVGVRPARVAIRGQRSRWGSCSSRGTISLNWRLLLVPSRLADYVLVHELCHLRHMDHSRAFWALVARSVPDHAERRAGLDALQASLPL